MKHEEEQIDLLRRAARLFLQEKVGNASEFTLADLK